MRAFVDSIGYFVWMKIIFLISLASIVGALIYQEIYMTPVCPLCWQQRMLIYAVAIISGVSIYVKDKLAHYSILIISAFGFYIAAGHYYYHYLKYVVKNPLALPCDAEGIVFGFVTIPLMSICVFTPFLIAGYFAWKKSKATSQ
jgi:disulfide bond formation protein DsbB